MTDSFEKAAENKRRLEFTFDALVEYYNLRENPDAEIIFVDFQNLPLTFEATFDREILLIGRTGRISKMRRSREVFLSNLGKGVADMLYSYIAPKILDKRLREDL